MAVLQQTEPLMTAEEFALIPDGDKRGELVRGRVTERPLASALAGHVSARIAADLGEWAERRHAGIALVTCGFVLYRDPDTVRAPSMAFVGRQRLPDGRVPEGFFPGAPDLAVEVVSPTDQAADVQEKVNDYLKAGTSLVWVVYPKLRQVVVHKSLAESFTVEEGGTLKGDPVLPDLSIPVKEIFAQ